MIRESIDLARKLGVVTRYSMAHLNREESVLEHTGGVALMAMLIGMKYSNIDMGLLLQKAISHDIEESEIGDIASPVKYRSHELRDELLFLGAEVVANISGRIGVNKLFEVWDNAKDGTLEGRIVKFCDVLSVVCKIHEEVTQYSNISFKNYARNTLDALYNLRGKETDEYLIKLINEAIKFNLEVV